VNGRGRLGDQRASLEGHAPLTRRRVESGIARAPAGPHAARPRIFVTVMRPPVPPRLVGTLSVLSWVAIRLMDMASAPIAFMAQ
jgi:hypothetical protein